jgi:hypothetical protein
MAFNKRIYRCLWRDKVDLLFWAVNIFLFIYSLYGHDVSKFLWVNIFYLYNAMYRRETFWQDRFKLWNYLKKRGINPDPILGQDDV